VIAVLTTKLNSDLEANDNEVQAAVLKEAGTNACLRAFRNSRKIKRMSADAADQCRRR
jgi:hypothetical protein